MKKIVFIVLVLALGAVFSVFKSNSQKPITTFEECVQAGNPVMESYPPQCAADGKTFTQSLPPTTLPS